MFWVEKESQPDGFVLVVGVSLVDGTYREFAGRGRSVGEAKAKAIALSWRASRVFRGLCAEARVIRRETSPPRTSQKQ